MALVPYEEKKRGREKKTWSNRNKHDTQHSLPDGIERPKVDYQKLKEMLSTVDAMRSRNNTSSSEVAHQYFMENYKQMFVGEKKKKGLPYHSLERTAHKESQMSICSSSTAGAVQGATTARNNSGEEEASHDIRDYLPLLHKMRKAENQQAQHTDRIKLLRKLLKKLPFERTASENEQILAAAENIPELASQVEGKVLKELCVVAQLETWKDENITLFGNTGLHVILKGTVKVQSYPWLKLIGDDHQFRVPTPSHDNETLPKLTVGSCFGTLEKVADREPNSRILTVNTADESCEFMKISTSDYARVIQQIKHRDETEKVNLMQSCQTYKYWSKQPLSKVANILEWLTFPPNTVIVSESYKAPFAAIIKSGECHVLRQVEVINKLKNGKEETKTKQVVMGSLGASESLGEVSIINNEPITCSIITASEVTMAVIEPDRLKELDETTIQLLHHSSEKTFGKLTKRDIYEEYVAQETKREWNEFKHNVVVDTINSTGIRPGYGKWAKN